MTSLPALWAATSFLSIRRRNSLESTSTGRKKSRLAANQRSPSGERPPPCAGRRRVELGMAEQHLDHATALLDEGGAAAELAIEVADLVAIVRRTGVRERGSQQQCAECCEAPHGRASDPGTG